MRIKVAIANFGTQQRAHLERVVEELQSFRTHHVDLTVFTTAPVAHPHVLCDESIGKGLPFACRALLVAAADDHDLFLYTENDMLITEDNVDAFLEHSRQLPRGQVSGFIRYEVNAAGQRILLDPNPHWGRLTHSATEHGFQLDNVHQGCWLLLQRDLHAAIASRGFTLEPHTGPYGLLEQGASDPYTQCGLTKVLPRDPQLCARLLIHHLPNKYMQFSEWIRSGITLETLLREHV